MINSKSLTIDRFFSTTRYQLAQGHGHIAIDRLNIPADVLADFAQILGPDLELLVLGCSRPTHDYAVCF